MARPWVKLHVAMLEDHALATADPLVGWTWCRLLLLAGRRDDDGRLGALAEVAWAVRMGVEDLEAVLVALNGRVAREGDVLAIRDWGEWQAPRDSTCAERQARHRARRAVDKAVSADGEADGKRVQYSDDGHGRPIQPANRPPRVTRDVTCDVTRDGHGSDGGVTAAEAEGEQEAEGRTPPTPPSPPPGRRASRGRPAGADAPGGGQVFELEPVQPAGAPRLKWQPALEVISAAFGGLRVTARNGQPLAWAGQVLDVAGRATGGDVPAATDLLRRYVATDDFRRFASKQNMAERLGKWGAAGQSAGAPRAGTRDPAVTAATERTVAADPRERLVTAALYRERVRRGWEPAQEWERWFLDPRYDCADSIPFLGDDRLEASRRGEDWWNHPEEWANHGYYAA